MIVIHRAYLYMCVVSSVDSSGVNLRQKRVKKDILRWLQPDQPKYR